MGEKGEHEQTEKHINPKLCAEIERTCAHLLLKQGEYSCVRQFTFQVKMNKTPKATCGRIVLDCMRGRSGHTSPYSYQLEKRNMVKVPKSRGRKSLLKGRGRSPLFRNWLHKTTCEALQKARRIGRSAMLCQAPLPPSLPPPPLLSLSQLSSSA